MKKLFLAVLLVVAVLVAAACAPAVPAGLTELQEEMKEVKAQIALLSTTQMSVRMDPTNPASPPDVRGQAGTFQYEKLSRGGIQFTLSTRDMPKGTYYAYLQLIPAQGPPKFERAGELQVGDDGRGRLAGTVAAASGTYSVGGFVRNVDKSAGPYTGSMFLCLEHVAISVLEK